jgi:PAS domain S-box-containing protein
MSIRRIIEFLPYVYEVKWPGLVHLDSWLGFIISVLIITGVILIGEVFYSLKKAEKIRHESEIKFRTLFESINDQIYVQDFNGNLIEVNRVICETLGYSKDELLNMQIKEIKTPKYSHLEVENIQHIKNKGHLIFESEHRGKNGTVFPVEIKSHIIDYSNKKAILSIARDISGRKQTERKILNAIIDTEEKNKERFAKDLHDGLGTLLSTINIYLNMLKSETTEPAEKDNILDFTKGLVNEAIQNTKEIAYNLMPDSISRFGLIGAINAHSERINKTGLISINFNHTSDIKKLNEDLELTLFRVIKELINNTLKHAKADTININLTKEESLIVLKFNDNGQGFDVESTLSENYHKGQGLSNLISRVKAINGTFKIDSKKGYGTSVLIKVRQE